MKTTSIILISLILSYLCIFSSCKKDQQDNNETKISKFSDDESHKNGQNCMTCHMSGGEGEGWFTIAGSVYDAAKETPYANATIKLFSGANGSGSLIKTIEVDGKGNFYTTETIEFSPGLYTSVTSVGGNEIFMSGSIKSGECNSCHGNSTNRLWVN